MKRPALRLFRNETQRYALLGAVFGFLFPIIATLLKIVLGQLPLSPESVIRAQQSDPIIWIVDTAPFFLGLFAAIAGRRQDIVERLAADLRAREKSLSGIQSSLEQRVIERTTDAETARQQAQLSAAQLKTVTELSQTIALIQDPEELLPLIAKQISERFGFYHIGVFLLDEKREHAVLRASNSEGGRLMLTRGHRLKVGGAGIVGYVAHSGQPRVTHDTGFDALFFKNPDLPETHSEVSLPMKIGDQIIGVLDVQSRETNAFNDRDVDILGILANQVAIVIQNARLLEQARTALETYTRSSRRVWTDHLEENSLSYSYLPGGTVTNAPLDIGTSTMRLPVSNQPVVLQPSKVGAAPTIAIPVNLRDQIIGVIHIEAADENRLWSEDEIAMIQAISERAAFALENARLFEETTRRAERERMVSQITARIGESTDIDRILRTTIQELGRTLGASRAFIQLEATASSNQNDRVKPLAKD